MSFEENEKLGFVFLQKNSHRYAPKAICYVTQLPLFSFFKQYLSELFLLSQPSSLSGNVPLERYISQLVSPIPIEFGLSRVFDKQYKLSFVIGKSTIPCVLPNLAVDFCITDVSFRYLFQALSVDTVITLLVRRKEKEKKRKGYLLGLLIVLIIGCVAD